MKNVVVIMKGGLGNQLFQYAFARNIQLKYGYDRIILDISELDGIRDRKYALQDFELPGNCVTTCSDNRYARYSRRRNPFLRVGMHICPKVVYDVGTFGNAFIWDRTELIDIDKRIKSGKDVVINGYWQSAKYFPDVSDTLKKDLKLIRREAYEKLDIYKKIRGTDSTCIHVRLGDYVNMSYYNTFGVEYYKDAIERVKEKKDSEFFVFSDDIEGAKKMLAPFYPELNFVAYDGQDTLSDFFLMSQCKNFIMANSSYSWWAQYLGEEKNIVTAPKRWTSSDACEDIYMDNWIRI